MALDADLKAQSYTKMMGELFREGGLLLGVFGALDGARDKPTPSPEYFVAVILVSMLFVLSGILIEANRSE